QKRLPERNPGRDGKGAIERCGEGVRKTKRRTQSLHNRPDEGARRRSEEREVDTPRGAGGQPTATAEADDAAEPPSAGEDVRYVTSPFNAMRANLPPVGSYRSGATRPRRRLTTFLLLAVLLSPAGWLSSSSGEPGKAVEVRGPLAPEQAVKEF